MTKITLDALHKSCYNIGHGAEYTFFENITGFLDWRIEDFCEDTQAFDMSDIMYKLHLDPEKLIVERFKIWDFNTVTILLDNESAKTLKNAIAMWTRR